MDKMAKLLEKKKKDGQEMDPLYKKSKMSVLESLRDQMSGMMKGDLEGAKLKKVEVAAPDSEGLAAGLDKAKDLVKKMPEDAMEMPEESSDDELMEACADKSADELDQMIKKLEMMKKEKAGM